MALLMDLIRQIRNARAEFNVTPGKRVPAIVVGGDKLEMLEAQRGLLAFLGKVDDEQLTLTRALDEKPQKAVALVAAEGVEAYLPLAGLVDLEQEIARLRKGAGRGRDRDPTRRGHAGQRRVSRPKRRRTWSSSNGIGWPNSRNAVQS